VCLFHNARVGFLLKRDRAARYCLAAMQGDIDDHLRLANGLDPDDPTSLQHRAGSRVRVNPDAIIRGVSRLVGD